MRTDCGCPIALLVWALLLGGVSLHGIGGPFRDEPVKPLPLTLQLNDKKVYLGGLLFHDRRLSRNNTIACVNCHDLQRAGTDHQRFSTGIFGNLGGLNSPTVFNAGFNFRQFWDGRAETLEEQAREPIQDPREMGSNWGEVIEKLRADDQYRRFFRASYPEGITPETVTNAIAEFERSLYTPNSRFDQYLRGDADAITPDEKRGYELFKSYGCVSCHQGMNVGGNMFQKFGVMKNYFKERKGKIKNVDLGRYNVTGNEQDKYYFKVPSLRLVAFTPPYFHDGSAKTLREAVDVMFEFQLGRIGSEADKNNIVKFLKTLAGNMRARGVSANDAK